MVKLGKLGVACALCLTMSLSLFTSGVFAQSANQSIASNNAQIVTATLLQGATSALQSDQRVRFNGSRGDCGAECGGGGCLSACGAGFGGGCFDRCGGFGNQRFIRSTRITRIVRIVRITKFFRYERFHRIGCGLCGDGWVGGGGG